MWDRGSGDLVRALVPELGPAPTSGTTEAHLERRRVSSGLAPALAIGGAAVAALALPIYFFAASSKTCAFAYAADTRGGTTTTSEDRTLSDSCSSGQEGRGKTGLVSATESMSGTGAAFLGIGVAGAAVAVGGIVMWVTKVVGHDVLEVRIGRGPAQPATGAKIGFGPGVITLVKHVGAP